MSVVVLAVALTLATRWLAAYQNALLSSRPGGRDRGRVIDHISKNGPGLG